PSTSRGCRRPPGGVCQHETGVLTLVQTFDPPGGDSAKPTRVFAYPAPAGSEPRPSIYRDHREALRGSQRAAVLRDRPRAETPSRPNAGVSRGDHVTGAKARPPFW